MRKPTNEKIERNGLRLLAVVSLACTLTAFGCAMNRMRGNGQSTEQTPEIGPANSSSAPGSSSGTMNPPMASGAIVVNSTSASAVDGQATLAADQGYQGRVLGGVNPPTTTQVSSSVTPAVMAPAITGADVAVATTPVPTVAMSGNATDATGTLATPANSAIAASTPVTNVSSQSALSTAPTATTSGPTSTSTTAKTAKMTTTSKAKSAKATAKAKTTKAAQPVQIQTTASGDIVMTNTTTNPPQQ